MAMLTKGDKILLTVHGTVSQGTVNGSHLIESFSIEGSRVHLALAEGEITLKPAEYAILGMWERVMGRARQAQYALRLLATPGVTATDQLEIAVLETKGRQMVTAVLNGYRLPEVGRLTISRQWMELEPAHPLLPLIRVAHDQVRGFAARRRQRHAIRSTEYVLRLDAGRLDPAVWQLAGSHAQILRQLVAATPRPHPLTIH